MNKKNKKKDIVFWTGVKNPDPHMQNKHGGFKYLDISRACWEKWCEKKDVVFVPYEIEDSQHADHNAHKPTWTRWFRVFELVEAVVPHSEINRILAIDGSSLIRWDVENFIGDAPTGLTAFKAHENLRWVSESVDGYRELFGGFNFDLTKYISCGWQVFDANHIFFLEKLQKFYFDNYDAIMDLQNVRVKRGTDQPVYNYLLQIKNIQVNMDWYAPDLFLNHMQRFDWFSHNFQTQDPNPFFFKYGKIWVFSGMSDRGTRYEMMNNIWQQIKHMY